MTAPVSDAVARVLQKLPDARVVKPGEWRDRCPVHQGTSTTSLSLTEGHEGRALLHCFAGCPPEAILASLDLTVSDLFADEGSLRESRTGRNGRTSTGQGGSKRRIVATYDYRDAAGHLRFQTVRFVPKDFCQRHPDGNGGWIWNLTGVELLPYRLPELLAADPTEWVLIGEGERDCDALAALGYVATTNPMGAGKWRPEFAPWFRDRRVAVLPDDDDPGRCHADQVAGLLYGDAAEIRVVPLPGVPPKGDSSDWIATGGDRASLLNLIEVAPVWHPAEDGDIEEDDVSPDGQPRLRFLTAREFAEQTPAETEWVVEPWVPLGGTTKIDGPPKRAGKTTLITRMVRAVLTGDAFLGTAARQGPVILLTEQAGTSFREALAAADLLDRDDLHLAVYRDIATLAWPDVVAETFALAVRIGAVLVVVDTFPQVARVRGDDENSAGRALAAIEPLQVAADIHRVGVGESGRGSSAFAGAVDIILHVNRPGGKLRPTVRKIEALSRFAATPEELYVELTDDGYVVLGGEADVVAAAVGAALAEMLPATEAEAKTVGGVKREGQTIERGLLDDLAERGIKAARSTLDTELTRWRAAGYAGRSGRGKKGAPYRWWLVQEPPETFLRSSASGALEESTFAERDADRTGDGGTVGGSLGATAPEADGGFRSSDDHDSLIGRMQLDVGLGDAGPPAEDGWEELDL